jgi:phenylacetate-coenzyme A ligase PaaK-like adenylate-forming protein
MNLELQLEKTKAFSFKENKDIFFQDLSKILLHHYNHNDYIKFSFDKAGFYPENGISCDDELKTIPYTHVNIFKYHHLQSCSSEQLALRLTSSGTNGTKSQMLLDQGSLDRVKKMAYNVYDGLGIVDDKKYNYLCFTYDPQIANDLGTAFTDELLTSFTQKDQVFYTFIHNGEDFIFEKERTVAKLKEFQKSPYPTRILGFPAFLYQLINEYQLELDLGGDSWLLTGGGWKENANKEIEKSKFKKLVQDKLGIPIAHTRDLFGMVEHGVPYVECEKSRFRIPNYSRVLVRDPQTMEILPYGKSGILQFICCYNTSYPSFNYLSTDIGMKLEHKDGLGDEIVLLGRAGLSKHAGCALKALELMR